MQQIVKTSCEKWRQRLVQGDNVGGPGSPSRALARGNSTAFAIIKGDFARERIVNHARTTFDDEVKRNCHFADRSLVHLFGTYASCTFEIFKCLRRQVGKQLYARKRSIFCFRHITSPMMRAERPRFLWLMTLICPTRITKTAFLKFYLACSRSAAPSPSR